MNTDKKILLLFASILYFNPTLKAQTEVKKVFYTYNQIKFETPYVYGVKNGIEKVYSLEGKIESEKPK